MTAFDAAHYGIEGFTSFRGRFIEDLTTLGASVYRNLPEQWRTGRRRWSIKCNHSGLVIGHADKMAVENAWVWVNLRAQRRIAEGGPRKVHAWVHGQLAFCPADSSPWYGRAKRITYDPLFSPEFRYADDDTVFLRASLVRFDALGMWAWR